MLFFNNNSSSKKAVKVDHRPGSRVRRHKKARQKMAKKSRQINHRKRK